MTGSLFPTLLTGLLLATPFTLQAAPADDFLVALHTLCGKAYAGRIVANEPPPTTPDPFEGQTLVMHVRECGDGAVGQPHPVGPGVARRRCPCRAQPTLGGRRHDAGTRC